MLIPIVLSVIIGYLLGSVPFALVIGKIFYKTDIRQHGSGNLGGGNAGRVLGKTAGLAVMTLDILKVTLSMLLCSFLSDRQEILMLAGVACAIGHCFPIFARFRGGKAVATMYGFLFGLVTVDGLSPLLFIIPLGVFLVTIFITRVVAVSSIASAFAVLVYAVVFENSLPLTLTLCFFTVIMILRHTQNLKRLLRGEENKVKWIGRG